uniref:Uncharacterized protein n=1 Tax=Meloidogyne floridensis TaxID=298350 RepID=A0A915NK81_9BILA
MWLFLLLFSIISLYKNVTPLSVFVKVSWRDNGENGLDYHRHLAGRQAGRFDLQLTSNTSGITIIAETNAYDTYHFLQAENEDEGLTNNYKLRIFNDDLNVSLIILIQSMEKSAKEFDPSTVFK